MNNYIEINLLTDKSTESSHMLTLYVAVTQFSIGKLRHCYVKSNTTACLVYSAIYCGLITTRYRNTFTTLDRSTSTK